MLSNPPRFIIKTKRVRDNVLWTLLGLFGPVNDGLQMGPGKTLDSNAEQSALIGTLNLLSATSRSLATKEIDRNLEKAIKFITNLVDVYSKVLVPVFQRSYFLSLSPMIKVVLNAITDIWHRKEAILPLSMEEFPSFNLIYNHVERGAMAAQRESHNVFGSSNIKREVQPIEAAFQTFKQVANGEHVVKVSKLDIFVGTRPAVLQVGQSVNRF